VGDATTDFGAPSIAPTLDASPMDAKELRRQRAILEACLDAFDDAVGAAKGRTLRTGPRGGGRSRTKIVAHVVGAEASYLRRIAGSPPRIPEGGEARAADAERAAVLEALNLAVLEGLPEAGPRGGKLWTPRYFVRRAAWHVLDHAWELEDRTS
jgi:hypothetical protein